MFDYESAAIGALAAQLRRGPKRLHLRLLVNAEFLLSILDDTRSYPLDFVTYELTGYRAPAGNSQLSESKSIRGDALAADLLVLSEEISADADYATESFAEPFFTVAELAERFNVSTKTIFRWHHRGLVGWRVRSADQRQRLMFRDTAVRRFVARNAELVQRGRSFSQLRPNERVQIIERARILAAAGERTVNAMAKSIAAETGRAVETIRLILKHHVDTNPHDGIFERAKVEVGDDPDTLVIWAAYQDGRPLEQIAREVGRAAGDVYRTVTRMRARELKAQTIEFVPAAEFEATEADVTILNDSTINERAPLAPLSRSAAADLPPYLRQLFRIPLLTAKSEVALFRRFNYLKFKADRMRAALDPETACATELDAVEALLSDAAAVKNQIVQANLRLVVSIAKRHAGVTQDLFELISDGNVSLMRAVDKFDFTRGFKFSTYGSWAIMKNFARSIPEQRHQLERYQTGREEVFESAVGFAADDHEDDFLSALRGTLERMLDSLEDREKAVLRQRFGLDTYGEPQTLEQIGQRLGVSKERIRQLETRAITKLRGEFGMQARGLLGVG